jgi:hypothetical protein
MFVRERAGIDEQQSGPSSNLASDQIRLVNALMIVFTIVALAHKVTWRHLLELVS